jgi:hypothetical protein
VGGNQLERHLQDVLSAVAKVLFSFVPFVSLAIVHFEGEKHELFAIHVMGHAFQEGETLPEFLERMTGFAHRWKRTMWRRERR